MNRVPESLEQLAQRQIDLEQQYKTRSIQRSRRIVQDAIEHGRAADIAPVRRIVAAAYDTVSKQIDALKAQKTAGVGGKYRAILRLIPTDVLAVIGLTQCVNAVAGQSTGEPSSAQAVLSSLGRQIQSELLAIQLNSVAPAYMNRVHEYLKERHTKSSSHILKTLRASAENVHFGHEPWSNSQCISIGKLLMQCVYSTGLFRWSNGSTRSQLCYLEPSESMAGMLEDIVQNADTINIKPPMLVPPHRHTTLFDGGYLTNIDNRGTYRNKHIHRRDLRQVAEAFKQAQPMLDALNKAQEVPYRVNRAVLALFQQARALGVGIGMPSANPAPRPEWRLDGTDKTEYSEREQEEFKEWKLRMRMWYNEEKTRVSQLRAVVTLAEMAEEFKNEQALYFPTCVDWRYRLYFKSSLHPQGSDLQKALLEFGRGKVLGPRGLFWLKVHVATCYGYDKALFEERAAWVDARIDGLASFVDSPFDSDAFREADSPWCFLAAAIDLVAALRSGDPENYVSHIPVAMDATNSGGQHFSALLRDPVGGRLTNLFWTGNAEKADLYMDVKQRTDSKVIMDLSNPDTVLQAQYWRENEITRSMTKRPSMTYFYSATIRSCAEYIVQGAHEEGYQGTDEYSLWAMSGYLAPRMRSAIEEANPAAAAAMQYLQSLARRVPTQKDLRWLTPLGGLVVNRYTESEETNVKIMSMNLTMLLAYNRNYDVCNRRKAASGIAPNFVHSLDSTHLMMCINAFSGNIVPIHDSMATHAADVDEMQRVIREQFFRLYTQHDPLAVVRSAAEAAGADVSDLPVPEKGTLNLQQVIDSPFFFC